MDTTFGARISIDMVSIGGVSSILAIPLARLSSTSVQDGLDDIVLDRTQSKSMIFEVFKPLGHLKRLPKYRVHETRTFQGSRKCPCAISSNLPLWS